MHAFQMNYFFDIASPFLYLMTALNMSVFVCFGIWSLRQRFRRYEEWAVRTQMIVLLAVLVFYVMEIMTLRLLLVGEPLYFMFALLGLVAAGLALYGHIAVSFLSRLMVELIVPDNPAARLTPRLGPAEMLEHEEDWEGALNEYYVLAHIYPGDALIYGRIANNLLRLERPGEAIKWFERALKHTSQPNDALVLLRRLWDACHIVNEKERAREAVLRFAENYPDFEASALLLKQLGENEVSKRAGSAIGTMLEALEQKPIEAHDLPGASPIPTAAEKRAGRTGLAKLEDAPLEENVSKKDAPTAGKKPQKRVLLEPMDDAQNTADENRSG